MPELRTDDGPRRLRAVWLGPKGSTMPFEWTYVQWISVLIGMALGWTLLGLAAWLVTADLVLAMGTAFLWGWPAGCYAAVRLMRGVSADEPVRAKVSTLRSQLSRRHQSPAPQPVRWVVAWPSIRDDARGSLLDHTLDDHTLDDHTPLAHTAGVPS